MDSEDFPNFAIDISDENLVYQAEEIEKQVAEKSRFVILQDDDLKELVASAEAKGTKRNTKWVIKTIEGSYKSQLVSL